MKICKLKLKNLNSFRNPVEIDFEKPPLGDASLVAITGPTGSGKTTLLDAICVALYGKTPRLSGTTNQHPRHLISHGEAEGFAEVYFQANDTCYHAIWSIKRNGSPRGQLFDNTGELITTKVAQEIESILGLDFDAFRRSVMLAQGEFAAFLKASNEERRTILEATAGIQIYDILRQALLDKVREVQEIYDKIKVEIDKILEVSPEQLEGAKAELARLQTEVSELTAQNQQIQTEKTREMDRQEDFEKLQSSEKRQEELLDQQPEIDALQAEQENADRAQRLFPEKQAFDNAKSALENAEKTLRVAIAEKAETDERVKADQADFDEKEEVYQTASAERDQKMEIYEEAKLDVKQAEGKFADANKQVPDLEDLGEQIKKFSSQLGNKQSEQSELEEKIQAAQTFLDENPLPSDRQQRLNRATGLLAQLDLQENQLETASASKSQHEKNVSTLKQKIKKLSDTHAGLLSEKTDAETALEAATAELNKLLVTGTREEWVARTQQAAKAQPIAQKYETTQNNLAGFENQLNALNDTAATLDTELEQVETDLANQTEVYQEATEVVQRCEAERESAKWANSVNQLRQHLHTGEPCRVCGSTEHPYANVVEDENEDLLQDAETALAAARTQAQASQDRLQSLVKKQAQTEQNRHNNAKQIQDCDTEIEALRSEIGQLLAEWQDIYPDADVSSKWASEQFTEANTAVAAIGDAEKAHTQALHAYQTVSQQLENSENNIANEKESLNETEQQLRDVSNNVEDLKIAVAGIETSLWDSLPKTFHSIPSKEAIDQFEDKIKAVEARESERETAKTQLQVLNTKIESDQSNLESLRKSHKELQAEIDEYQREGEAFLDAVRKKTGGLEMETEINAAVSELETELKAKKNEHGEVQQRLQKSENLLIQKQTAHEIRVKQHKEGSEKFKAARTAYFDKLEDVGFDSPEAHNNAFRDETQVKEITDRIKAHKDEMDQLKSDIKVLKARFGENPFDPEVLGRITVQLEEIEEQHEKVRDGVGRQQQKIDDLKRALKKREVLANELRKAEQELERWKRLQDTIPRNELRDFALEIMFRQMGNLANEQLRYLTSERYELKVESIGDLTVVDRWNANEERPVQTLSGGESFLTSLALALALSELSSGRAQLNSLFLDEGFGTLDSETLDIAIAALEGLRMQGRNIFLISHIKELTRRLPVKIEVSKKGNGSSSVRIAD